MLYTPKHIKIKVLLTPGTTIPIDIKKPAIVNKTIGKKEGIVFEYRSSIKYEFAVKTLDDKYFSNMTANNPNAKDIIV